MITSYKCVKSGYVICAVLPGDGKILVFSVPTGQTSLDSQGVSAPQRQGQAWLGVVQAMTGFKTACVAVNLVQQQTRESKTFRP